MLKRIQGPHIKLTQLQEASLNSESLPCFIECDFIYFTQDFKIVFNLICLLRAMQYLISSRFLIFSCFAPEASQMCTWHPLTSCYQPWCILHFKLSFMTIPPSRNCRVLDYVVTLATVNLSQFKSCPFFLFLEKVQAPCLQLSRRLSYNTRGSWKLYVKHMLSPQHSPINDRNAKQFKRGKYAPMSEGKQNKIKQ